MIMYSCYSEKDELRKFITQPREDYMAHMSVDGAYAI